MDSRETVLSNTLDPQVPTHAPSTNRNRVMVMIPFLLVHEMLLNMVSKRVNRLGQLAELLPDSPLFNLRKAFCVKNHLDWMKTIAIGFHGDGVPHSKKGSAQVFSWNVLGKSLAERFFFTCIAIRTWFEGEKTFLR